MESKDFILLFFIIYDIIITWVFYFVWWETRKRSMEKDKLLDEYHNELAKRRK